MPALVLKKMVMGNFDKGVVDEEIADSIDFMVQSVSREELVSFMVQSMSRKELDFMAQSKNI